MKFLKNLLAYVLILFGFFICNAQPFTLDKSIKPVEIKLQDDNRKGREGEKFTAVLGTVDSTKYYYVTGHDMFQFIDVIIKGFGNKNALEASIAVENWNNIEERQSSSSAQDGIIQFKIRAYGSFGIKINSAAKETINYTIMVHASPQVKTYLGSPFTKIKEADFTASEDNVEAASSSDNKDSGSDNMVLYIALGVALLVIGVLAGKLMNKTSAKIIVLCLCLPFQHYAQSGATPGFFHKDRYYNGEDLDNGKFEEDLRKEMEGGYDPTDDITDLNEKLNSIKEFLENAVNLYNSYNGLGACINSTPPLGEPRIPSFCATPVTTDGFSDDTDCAGCFLNARQDFNRVRYLFDQLATIYKCTKNFSNAAISFGDNASGIHAVSGMAWQTQRRNIEKSIVDLEKAYDNKYAELLQSLSEAMLKLSECEARYGVEDWFDRFGYMYFEFIKEKYQRKD